MNTEIIEKECTNVDDLHNINSLQNETSNIHVNTEDDDDGNALLQDFYALIESHGDKSNETGDNVGININEKEGTLENNKDKCSLNSNIDPKHLEIPLEHLEVTPTMKSRIDSEECIQGNGQQGIDLEDENHSNVKNLTKSIISTEKILNISEKTKDNSLDNYSRISLVDDENCNNEGKSTESLTEKAQDDEGTGIELLSTVQIENEESLDKHASNNNEQLSTNIEILHSNTNVIDSQANMLPADNNISSQNKAANTSEENSGNLIQNQEGDDFNISMVVVQDNQRRTSLDDKSKIKKLNNLPEDSHLHDNKDNKRLLQSMSEMEKEKLEVMPDLPAKDQQEQQQQLPEGWKRETVQRSRKSKMDVYYVSPTGIRLRSEAEVYRYCEQERLNLDISIFDFGYEEVELTDSDTTVTLSDDDSSDDQVVWASTGISSNNKKSKEPSAKANALNPFDIVNSQISKRIYIGRDIVLTPKVIPFRVTVNAKRQLPEFLKNYTVLRHDDYLAFRTKEQFWQEPFMKCIYQAINDRVMSIAEASELVGVKYQKLSQEYNESTTSPWLTEAFTEYLGNKVRDEANNQEASTSQNSQLSAIRAASPSQKILSTSRPGAPPEYRSITKNFVPPSRQPTTDMGVRMKRCSCKKSQCLQQTCICFNNFEQCMNCKCKDCHNTDKDPLREAALKKRLTKMYPSLSKEIKISNAASMAAALAVQEMMRKGGKGPKDTSHNGAAASKTGKQSIYGCTCKTQCHRKSCGCYSKGLNCSDACLCINCNNKIMIHSIFNAHNLPMNPASSAPPQIVESVTDSIRRLFPQAAPETIVVPNSIPNNVSRGKSGIVPNFGTNFVSNDMHSVEPNVVPCSLPSDIYSPLPNTVANTVSVVEPPSQPRSGIPTNNIMKGLEDKETFLHKWVEANYKVDASNFWEENLIFLHLKNTIDRLGLGHTITISQLRDAVRRVFGPGVGPNKHQRTSYWLYTGIKPVLAYPGKNSMTPPISLASGPPTSLSSGPPTSLSSGPPTTLLTAPSSVGVTTSVPTNCTLGTQMVTIPSSVVQDSTAEAPGTNHGSPMVTIHNVESLATSSSNTLNKEGPSNDESQKISSNKEDRIISWLQENYIESSGSIDIDSLYQKCLSSLATTNKVFNISEFITCVKSVFGTDVGPKPCYDAKGILRWHFVGIWSKNGTVNSSENGRNGSTTESAVTSDDDVCIIDGDNDSVVEDISAEAPCTSGTTDASPMVTMHNVENRDIPSSITHNKEGLSNNEAQKKHAQYLQSLKQVSTSEYLKSLQQFNKEECIIGWLRENYRKSPGSIDIDSLYQKCLSNLTTTYKVFSISEFISCVKSVFGADVGPKPCYDAKGIQRWYFVGIWPKDATGISAENSHAGSTTKRRAESDDDVCIIGDNPEPVEPEIDDHFRRSLGADYQQLFKDNQPPVQHNKNSEEPFCPVIEEVYTEPQVSQTSIGGPRAPWGGFTAPTGLLGLNGPHGVASGPMGVGQPADGVSGNVIPSSTTLLTNPAGSSVARAVEVGVRVQRGPDWIHGDEDGHGLGTVTELSKNGTVRVLWDCSNSSEGVWYNMGLSGKYRLKPADDAPRLPVPEFMPPSMLVRPPPPLLMNPSARPTALGNFAAPSLSNPSAPMLGNPHGPMLGNPHGPMLGIPPGLMLSNHHGPMLRPMMMNPSGPMLGNPTVASRLGNTSAHLGNTSAHLGNTSAPASVNPPSQLFVNPPQAITAAAAIASQMPVWTHHRVQIGTKVEPGPNWYRVEDNNLGKGLVLEVEVIGSRQYAKVKWNKGPSKWGWYCYTTGEIQLSEGLISHKTSYRTQITHPSGFSRRERRMLSVQSHASLPRVGTIDTEEMIMEWLLNNCVECAGAEQEQMEVYNKFKLYMHSRDKRAGGPIVFSNIMRKLFGTQVGPKRSAVDGVFKWRYQGIIGSWTAQLIRDKSTENRMHELQEKDSEMNHQQDKEVSTQKSMCQEDIETIVTDSAQTCSSTFEGHNFSPPRSKQSSCNHPDYCGSTGCLRNSRSPSPMSRSPSPMSTLSPASSLEQLSDIDSHDGTNLDLEDSIFDDSGISDTDLCGFGTVSPTKQKDLPATHLKFPDCPYDPIKDRKMWLLYMDTFGK